MPVSVPNQKMITVHREKPLKNFLGIKNENWMLASRLLGPYGLQIYLYLAANADGWEMAFSPKAVELDTGLKQSTCRDHLKDLVKFGYLVQRREGSTYYDFYEQPKELFSSHTTSPAGIESQNNLEFHVDEITRHTFAMDSDSITMDSDNKEINNKEINNNTISPNRSLTNNGKHPIEELKCPDKGGFVF